MSGSARTLPPAPALVPMAQIRCEVGELVSLGPGKHGERRYVPLGGGTVVGPELNGRLVEGGVDWQVNRADGVLDIAAHYVIRAEDGALIEVQSDGMFDQRLRFGHLVWHLFVLAGSTCHFFAVLWHSHG